jgi:hypothetical protein
VSAEGIDQQAPIGCLAGEQRISQWQTRRIRFERQSLQPDATLGTLKITLKLRPELIRIDQQLNARGNARSSKVH